MRVSETTVEAIMLRHRNGMPMRDIAQQVGSKRSTVQRVIARGRGRMVQNAERREAGEEPLRIGHAIAWAAISSEPFPGFDL